MPEKRQTGVIMGGIVVSEQKEDTQKTKRISVGNTFSYTLGVQPMITIKPIKKTFL